MKNQVPTFCLKEPRQDGFRKPQGLGRILRSGSTGQDKGIPRRPMVLAESLCFCGGWGPSIVVLLDSMGADVDAVQELSDILLLAEAGPELRYQYLLPF